MKSIVSNVEEPGNQTIQTIQTSSFATNAADQENESMIEMNSRNRGTHSSGFFVVINGYLRKSQHNNTYVPVPSDTITVREVTR
ncbi:hypothetical protein B5G50_19880 [Brevibacillus brevis]|nr:hypothetical protein B5G50_19880 [Brevibacillus brevis]